MNRQGFTLVALLLILAAAFVLGSAAYFLLHSTSGVNPDYYAVAKKINAECGDGAQLLGVAIGPTIDTYTFTKGSCGSASSSEVIDIDYALATNLVSESRMRTLGRSTFLHSEYDPIHPIVLSTWKITLEQALQTIFGGGRDHLDPRGNLQLYQDGTTLIWRYAHSPSTGGELREVVVNATDGKVITERTFVLNA